MKPLGGKAYGSIPHLPGSRRGPGDHACHEGQSIICTERARDRHDEIIVQEKVDGSCCAVARVEGAIVALGRAGYLAQTSPYEQHQRFADWVRRHVDQFAALPDGWRVVGEWMLQAHGTRYRLPHEPFVVFDLIAPSPDRKTGLNRQPYDDCRIFACAAGLPTPRLISRNGPLSIEAALAQLEPSGHGALDPVEGAVWRVQRKGAVDFLAKYVRHDKLDGCYLPEVSGLAPVWNEINI